MLTTRVHSTVWQQPECCLPCNRTDSGNTNCFFTVWKKSLLLNCSGFTVFDSQGKLVFRVDNYGTDHRDEIVLMDAAGKPLLTMRKKKLLLGDQWQAFEGEPNKNRSEGSQKPTFWAKKQGGILQTKTLVHVFGGAQKNKLAFAIHGSYIKRSCQFLDGSGRVVAEIRKKEAVCGVNYADVFQLVVQPGLGAAPVVAMVILLDQMFTPKWSSAF